MSRKYNESKEAIEQRSRKLKMCMYMAGVSVASLSTELKKCVATIYTYINNPGKIPSGETDTIASMTNMSEDDLIFIFHPTSYRRYVANGQITKEAR